MIRRFIVMTMLVAFSVCSFAYAAPDRTVSVISMDYDQKAAMPFDIIHLKGPNNIEDWYVVSEDFAMLQIETDVNLRDPVQQYEQNESNATMIELGHLAAENMIRALYGVDDINIHAGLTYFGTPAKFPNGAILVNDINFVHSGIMWTGRVVIYSTDTSNPSKDAMLLYPLTR